MLVGHQIEAFASTAWKVGKVLASYQSLAAQGLVYGGFTLLERGIDSYAAGESNHDRNKVGVRHEAD